MHFLLDFFLLYICSKWKSIWFPCECNIFGIGYDFLCKIFVSYSILNRTFFGNRFNYLMIPSYFNFADVSDIVWMRLFIPMLYDGLVL